MERKIYLLLVGGLGNQLFQYACAKNLAIKLNSQLIIDNKSGFYFDKNFKRNFALPNNFDYQKISILDSIIFFILKIIKKTLFKNKICFSFFNSIIIDETNQKKYINNFFSLTKNFKNIYLIGFFQSEKYFVENKKKILDLILKNKIKNKKLLKLKKKLNNKSVMIGIRLFEESPKNIKYNFGGIENFKFYNNSIKKIKIRLGSHYVFTTSNDNKKIQDSLNRKVFIINSRNGFVANELDYLLLMSNFNNFIISNSSFYWWSAYLAEFNKKIKIVASKKFVNKSTIHKRWK